MLVVVMMLASACLPPSASPNYECNLRDCFVRNWSECPWMTVLAAGNIACAEAPPTALTKPFLSITRQDRCPVPMCHAQSWYWSSFSWWGHPIRCYSYVVWFFFDCTCCADLSQVGTNASSFRRWTLKNNTIIHHYPKLMKIIGRNIKSRIFWNNV